MFDNVSESNDNRQKRTIASIHGQTYIIEQKIN